jgi:hypothetical protein
MASAGADETLGLAAGCVYRQAILPPVTANLTIDGNGATLKGGSGLSATAGTLTVDHLDFRQARIVVTRLGALTVTGGAFSGNTAADDGGAIDVNAPAAGALSVTGAVFTRNSAADGGAIDDFSFYGGSITDCVFTGNIAASGSGGAVLASAEGGLLLSGDVIRGNTALLGGGGVLNATEVEIDGSRITGNHAGGFGGGLFTESGDLPLAPAAVITGSVLRGNTAVNGAGVYSDEGITDITGSVVDGNLASGNGGGVYNHGSGLSQAGVVNLKDSTVARNFAGGSGGGVYDSQWQVTATGTEITRNMAGAGGGGIYVTGPAAAVTLTTSPVLRNRPDNCEPANTITGCTG